MKYLFLVIVCSFMTHIAVSQQSSFFLSGNYGYSTIYKVQDALIPFYYDTRGGTAFSLSGGVKLKKIFNFYPVVEMGLEKSSYSLRHFGGITDTAKHEYAEDKYTIKNSCIIVKAMLQHDLFDEKISLLAGFKLSYAANETEDKTTYLLSEMDRSKSRKTQRIKTDMKNNNRVNLNAAVQILIPVNSNLGIGADAAYGISLLKNIREQEFLAREFILSLKARYFF